MLATSSIVVQMKHEAIYKNTQIERAARLAQNGAIATREKLPPGIEEMTPQTESNRQSRLRLKSFILRRVPGSSPA